VEEEDSVRIVYIAREKKEEAGALTASIAEYIAAVM
jgi:hypothetical protein